MSACTILVAVLMCAIIGLIFIAAKLMDTTERFHKELDVCRKRLAWIERKDRQRKR